MTDAFLAGQHPDGGAPQAYFHQEWAQLEDALARAQARLSLRCKHTLARLVFDALVQCRRQGLQVQLSLPDTALNRQSAIAWERLSAIGGQISWRSAASDGMGADASFPALTVVLDDALVFTGKLSHIYWLGKTQSANLVYTIPLVFYFIRYVCNYKSILQKVYGKTNPFMTDIKDFL
jgi:hypothetical protein